jgi:hypothetical protein
MTHDELLIEINRRLDVSYYNGDPQSMQALRAVVELHKTKDGKKFCKTCGKFYPCSTIQAIEKELG